MKGAREIYLLAGIILHYTGKEGGKGSTRKTSKGVRFRVSLIRGGDEGKDEPSMHGGESRG